VFGQRKLLILKIENEKLSSPEVLKVTVYHFLFRKPKKSVEH
jgi:hypothetical protein